MRKIACLVILSVFIFTAGCISTDEPSQTTEKPKVVEKGDVVTFTFIGWEKASGAVFETSIKDANVTKETTLDGSYNHDPMRVTVGAANPAPGTIKTMPGLEEALIGMEEAETKTVEIPPEKAYGNPNESQIKKINRIQEIPRYTNVRTTEEIEYEEFKQMAKGQIAPGNIVELIGWWDAKILEVTEDTVKITHLPEEGALARLKHGPYEVVEITEEKIRLEFAPKEGEEFRTFSFKAIVTEIGEENVKAKLNYQVGETVRNTLPKCEDCFAYGKITEVTDEYIEADFNMPLKGKTVVFKVKVVDIQKVGE